MTSRPRVTPARERVPIHADNSQRGNKNPPRSGRNPLPIASATALHIRKDFSPFQQRQQQYAVSSENNPRYGRKGPSIELYQNGGATRSSSTAALPTHSPNMRFPRANISGRQRAAARSPVI